MKYYILQYPGHNRAFYLSADKLALAELTLTTMHLSTPCQALQLVELAGVRYLSFSTPEGTTLTKDDYAALSHLSFIFACFEEKKMSDETTTLLPVLLPKTTYLDPKVSTLLKYKGKTNELFTKMMIHVAMLSSTRAVTSHSKLLDPTAGRGTTLYEAAIYGLTAYGIEIDAISVHEGSTFFQKYLKTEHIIHKLEKQKLDAGVQKRVTMQHFSYALSREEMKKDSTTHHLCMIEGRAQDASLYFRKPTFQYIVADLPYGVLHGNVNQENTSRSPKAFLQECLRAWHAVTITGGSIVLAWNTLLLSRHQLNKLLEEAGWTVLKDAPYTDFEHRVDQSIMRDIIVARK